MIDKIGESRVRETSFEETPEVKEQPAAQDHIASETEPVVTASSEYKSGLIAEKQMDGQSQEMLLRNQLNDTRQPISFTNNRAPRETPKSPGEILREMPKQIPEQLSRTLGEIGDAWSHPGQTLDAAAEEAKRKWDDIKNGR